MCVPTELTSFYSEQPPASEIKNTLHKLCEITITAHFVKFDSYRYDAQIETEREATILIATMYLKMANVEKFIT